jgi:hypothetical protein
MTTRYVDERLTTSIPADDVVDGACQVAGATGCGTAFLASSNFAAAEW